MIMMKKGIYRLRIQNIQCTRNSSSLAQLRDDISYVYRDCINLDILTGITEYRVACILCNIMSNNYRLSPLKIKFVMKSEFSDFLSEMISDYPDIGFGVLLNQDFRLFVLPGLKEDGLVLMGLSRTIFRYSYGGLPDEGYRIIDLLSSFYYTLSRMGQVNRVYKIDLMSSLYTIPTSLIKEKVKHFVGDDGYVFHLISSFLTLPIYDDAGNLVRASNGIGMTQMGEITRVLFDLYLKDTFDHELPKRFPGIIFCRFLNQVFISSSSYDEEFVLDEIQVHTFLYELFLRGKIVSVVQGDDPLRCYNKIISLDSDSYVEVCGPPES